MAGAIVSVIFGDVPGRANLDGLVARISPTSRARSQSRWRARRLCRRSTIPKLSADRWAAIFATASSASAASPTRPCACCSSRPIRSARPSTAAASSCIKRCANWPSWCEVHVIVMLDYAHEAEPNRMELPEFCAAEWNCASARLSGKIRMARPRPTLSANSTSPKWNGSSSARSMRSGSTSCSWNTHRSRNTCEQLRPVLNVLFEHDIYFQSIAAGSAFHARNCSNVEGPLRIPARAAFRAGDPAALRPGSGLHAREPRIHRIVPARVKGPRSGRSAGRRQRVGIIPSRAGRASPLTMLFLGSFRHAPNQIALDWFATEVLAVASWPHCPHARLIRRRFGPARATLISARG